jgi:hypothetical protein
MGGTETSQPGFVHSALLYHSQQEYLDFVVRFVVDGLARDEPVLVAVPDGNLALLRDALKGAASGFTAELHMADIAEVGRNPSRFMAMEASFADEHPGRRVRIVSQLAWPGRTEDELVACIEDEALANGALEGYQATGLCLYDAARLDDDVLADARATHPLLWRCGAPHRSAEYAPDEVLERCNRPLPAKPGAVTYMVRKSADLRPVRSFAVNYADWPSGGTTSIWCARRATPGGSMTRWSGAWTRARAAPPAAGCFWSTPYRIWCACTPRPRGRPSRHTFGSLRRPVRMADGRHPQQPARSIGAERPWPCVVDLRTRGRSCEMDLHWRRKASNVGPRASS